MKDSMSYWTLTGIDFAASVELSRITQKSPQGEESFTDPYISRDVISMKRFDLTLVTNSLAAKGEIGSKRKLPLNVSKISQTHQ